MRILSGKRSSLGWLIQINAETRSKTLKCVTGFSRAEGRRSSLSQGHSSRRPGADGALFPRPFSLWQPQPQAPWPGIEQLRAPGAAWSIGWREKFACGEERGRSDRHVPGPIATANSSQPRPRPAGKRPRKATLPSDKAAVH